MTKDTRQLALEFPHSASFAREDFLAADGNADALAIIEAWPNWPSPTMMLVGPTGSGKSHLGAIWARQAKARVMDGAKLGEVAHVELMASQALLIDDANAVGEAESALFHVLNIAREQNITVLMTADRAPDLWGVKTPDLLSRLRLAPIVALGEPDLELTQAVLLKLFSDRQLLVEASVVSYIALRIERSLGAARGIVEALDREALARGKPVTRAMAGELLRDADEA